MRYVNEKAMRVFFYMALAILATFMLGNALLGCILLVHPAWSMAGVGIVLLAFAVLCMVSILNCALVGLKKKSFA